MTADQASGQIAPSPAVRSKRRLDYIDAVRGVACFWVVLHHSFTHLSVPMPVPAGALHSPLELFVRFAAIGWLGVSLFLVLSGFCLFYPLAARYDLPKIQLDLATFAKRRAWRILPPYYAALLLFAAIELGLYRHKYGHWNWHAAFLGPKDALFHVLMLHNLSPETIGSINAAFWSLALESQLYVIFPLLVWCAMRFGIASILAVTLAVSLAWQMFCFQKFGVSLAWTAPIAVYYYALPGRCFEFAAGMVAAYFVARPRPGQDRIAYALMLIPLVPAVYLVGAVYRFGPGCDQLWGVIFAATLVALSALPDARFERNALLRWLVRLGAFSYSVYLVHFPLIDIITPRIMHLPPGLTGQYLAAFARLPLLIGAGYLFHLACERPFMPGRPRSLRQAEIAAAVSPAP